MNERVIVVVAPQAFEPAVEAADVRTVIIDAGERHVHLRIQVRPKRAEIRADVARPHSGAETLQA